MFSSVCIHFSLCCAAVVDWTKNTECLHYDQRLTDPTVYFVTLYYDEYYHAVPRPPL